MKASRLDLEAIKLLIEEGANPFKKLGQSELTPFGEALMTGKFDIIDYYVDSLEVDVTQPVKVRTSDSLFVQDYVKKFMAYQEGSTGYQKSKRWLRNWNRWV